MVARAGYFDECAVIAGWFDATEQLAGWFDPDLLDSGFIPPTPVATVVDGAHYVRHKHRSQQQQDEYDKMLRSYLRSLEREERRHAQHATDMEREISAGLGYAQPAQIDIPAEPYEPQLTIEARRQAMLRAATDEQLSRIAESSIAAPVIKTAAKDQLFKRNYWAAFLALALAD